MRNELGQSFTLLPGRSKPRIWVAKPRESGIKKFIGRRSVASGALSVERPAKYELRRTIVFSSHSSEPMVDERRFSDSAPGNDCNDVRRMKNRWINPGSQERNPCCHRHLNDLAR